MDIQQLAQHIYQQELQDSALKRNYGGYAPPALPPGTVQQLPEGASLPKGGMGSGDNFAVFGVRQDNGGPIIEVPSDFRHHEARQWNPTNVLSHELVHLLQYYKALSGLKSKKMDRAISGATTYGPVNPKVSSQEIARALAQRQSRFEREAHKYDKHPWDVHDLSSQASSGNSR